MNGGAVAFGHLDHAGAEVAADPDHHLIARLDQIGDAGLHPCAAGARHGEGELVGGPEDVLEHAPGVIHDGQVLGIEVAEGGFGQSGKDAGADIARAGAHEDAFGRVDFGIFGFHS